MYQQPSANLAPSQTRPFQLPPPTRQQPLNPQALPILTVATATTNTPQQLQLPTTTQQQIGTNTTTLQQGVGDQQQQFGIDGVPPLGATRTLLHAVTNPQIY